MIQAVRQHVVVSEDRQIVIKVPDLEPGSGAEVIVLPVEAAMPSEQNPVKVKLSALIGSCKGMFKSAEEADKFLSEERDAWER